MKKLIIIALAVLMVLSLAACSPSSDTQNDPDITTENGNLTQNSDNQTTAEQKPNDQTSADQKTNDQTPTNQTTAEQKPNDQTPVAAPTGKLPENFKLVQNNGVYTFYKIGNDFIIDYSDYCEYLRYDGLGKYDFFSNSSGEFVMDGKREFGDFFDRMYDLNWTKTGNTKEIAGVNCVEYRNPTDENSYMYVFEDASLIFEQGMGSMRFVYTTEYDPSITKFPVATPD